MFDELMPFVRDVDLLLLNLKVYPKAKMNKISGCATDSSGKNYLKIYVTAVPEKGKANKAVVDLLAKELNIAKSNIEILKGQTAQIKLLQISGELEEVTKKLRIMI